MFERYNEKARRTIFFARYEASQFGSPSIATEHLLLALLREDPKLMSSFLSAPSMQSIRPAIEGAAAPFKTLSTKIDLPLSNENKRALAYAAQESESLGYGYIGPEHLLLGLLHQEASLAARLLTERGVTLTAVRESLERTPPEQRTWQAGETRMLRTKHRIVRSLNTLCLLTLGLLVIQVWAKTSLDEFVLYDAILYSIALPLLLTVTCALTWFLRDRRVLTTKSARWRSILAALATVTALLPVLFALKARLH